MAKWQEMGKKIGKELGIGLTEEERHRRWGTPEEIEQRREQFELAKEQAAFAKRISFKVRCEYAGSTFPADELRKEIATKELQVGVDGIVIEVVVIRKSRATKVMIPWQEIVGIALDDETFMKVKSRVTQEASLSSIARLEPVARVSSKQQKQCFMTIATDRGDLLLRILGHSANDMRGRLAASKHLWDKPPAPSQEQPSPSQSDTAPSPDKSIGEELERLVGLHERGALTDDEFARLKANVLKAG